MRFPCAGCLANSADPRWRRTGMSATNANSSTSSPASFSRKSQLPEPDSGPWEERLRAVVTGIDARLHDHPGIATVMLERMRSTDRRLMNGILEILQSAGFEGPSVFLSYAMIHTYLFGRYQVVELDTPDPSDVDPGELEDTLAKLVPHLDGPARARLLHLRRRHHHRRAAGAARREETAHAAAKAPAHQCANRSHSAVLVVAKLCMCAMRSQMNKVMSDGRAVGSRFADADRGRCPARRAR